MSSAYIAPLICGIFGIAGVIETIRFYKHGGTIKIRTLILALIGIPACIALLLQLHGIINYDKLAAALGSEYVTARMELQQEQ